MRDFHRSTDVTAHRDESTLFLDNRSKAVENPYLFNASYTTSQCSMIEDNISEDGRKWNKSMGTSRRTVLKGSAGMLTAASIGAIGQPVAAQSQDIGPVQLSDDITTDEKLTIPAVQGASIHGHSELEAATSVSINLYPEDEDTEGPKTFTWNATGENGDWEFVMDFSQFEPGDTFTCEIDSPALDNSIERTGELVEDDSVREVQFYANEDDIVDENGLRAAIADWREDDISTDLLRDVIAAWRSSDQV